jgi:hypothetical protein
MWRRVVEHGASFLVAEWFTVVGFSGGLSSMSSSPVESPRASSPSATLRRIFSYE